MPATKKFTARNLPALTEIAHNLGLQVHRCSSKCYDVTPHGVDDDRRAPLDESEQINLEQFIEAASEKFEGYEVYFTNSYSWVRVTWEKDTRTQSQIDNVD